MLQEGGSIGCTLWSARQVPAALPAVCSITLPGSCPFKSPTRAALPPCAHLSRRAIASRWASPTRERRPCSLAWGTGARCCPYSAQALAGSRPPAMGPAQRWSGDWLSMGRRGGQQGRRDCMSQKQAHTLWQLHASMREPMQSCTCGQAASMASAARACPRSPSSTRGRPSGRRPAQRQHSAPLHQTSRNRSGRRTAARGGTVPAGCTGEAGRWRVEGRRLGGARGAVRTLAALGSVDHAGHAQAVLLSEHAAPVAPAQPCVQAASRQPARPSLPPSLPALFT